MKVYLDNAATTPIDHQVVDAMIPYLKDHYGNPSSVHAFGRQTRAAIEKARKQIASALNASSLEIYFTSGGTESDNMAIRGLVAAHGLRHIITTPLEHHAVLHTVQEMAAQHPNLQLHYLRTDAQGRVDYEHLAELLATYDKALVTLMHGNNEIGNLTDLAKVGQMCEDAGAFFHSDTVQTVGHYPLDVKALKLHAMVGSAHKFHGPKGVGFLYLRKDCKIPAFLTGGGQERNMRGGTENLYAIVGMAEALNLSVADMEAHAAHIRQLKQYLQDKIATSLPFVQFNGGSAGADSLYTVLSLLLPKEKAGDMFLFNLDLAGVAASGGSACSSGAATGSHVLAALQGEAMKDHVALRLSLSRYNTQEEMDYVVEKMVELCKS